MGLSLLPGVSKPDRAVQAQADSRCFEATGFCISGPIRTFWEAHGGLSVFGFPIAPQQEMLVEGQTLVGQWFERVRMELHPEYAPPYDVLLSRLGVEALAQRGRAIVPDAGEQQDTESCRLFAATGHTVCGDMLQAWQTAGIELDGLAGWSDDEHLALFGLPVSSAQVEVLSTGESGLVQWFERARFEQPLAADNTPGPVQFGLLGREVYAQTEPSVSYGERGLLAFVSDRDGQPEIYQMHVDGTGLLNLTQHPALDVQPAWSPDGSRLAFASNRVGNFDIYVLELASGQLSNLTAYWDQFVAGAPADDTQPAWSPDGSQLVFESQRGGDTDIYVMDVTGWQVQNLTQRPVDGDGDPAWSPDGSQLAFVSNRAGSWNIYMMQPDGQAQTLVAAMADDVGAPDWAPDNQRLVFHSLVFRPNTPANFDIGVMLADGSSRQWLTEEPSDDANPSWSSDGAYVAFDSNRNGSANIWLMRVDGSDLRQVTDGPGQSSDPDWYPFQP